MHAIWVICLEDERGIGEHSYQLLGKARQLHENGECEVTAICLQLVNQQQQMHLAAYGADRIIYCSSHDDDIYEKTRWLADLVERYRPPLLLFAATEWGRAMAASLSALVGAGLTAECIEIHYDANERYVFSRTALNASVIANIVCINTDIQMCTVGKNVFSSCYCSDRPSAKILEVKKNGRIVPTPSTQILQILSQESLNGTMDCSLDDADIILAFGRGLSHPDGLHNLRKLAKSIHAEVGGSRAVVEKGLLPRSKQIGQSGISVSPKLYIAFGISGASQHLVGIKNANCIVAINNDPNAPIFDAANYRIVDDCFRIITELNELLTEQIPVTMQDLKQN